ncbi:hypothetical protein GQ42DRAFT_68267 [Ramicandelaber brevisporus]|nr:hypothetical protein GQ42DRAFT_68267 [Ramicandelaber brevisporus]
MKVFYSAAVFAAALAVSVNFSNALPIGKRDLFNSIVNEINNGGITGNGDHAKRDLFNNLVGHAQGDADAASCATAVTGGGNGPSCNNSRSGETTSPGPNGGPPAIDNGPSKNLLGQTLGNVGAKTDVKACANLVVGSDAYKAAGCGGKGTDLAPAPGGGPTPAPAPGGSGPILGGIGSNVDAGVCAHLQVTDADYTKFKCGPVPTGPPPTPGGTPAPAPNPNPSPNPNPNPQPNPNPNPAPNPSPNPAPNPAPGPNPNPQPNPAPGPNPAPAPGPQPPAYQPPTTPHYARRS